MPNRLFNISPEATATPPSVINVPQSVITFAAAPTTVTAVARVLGVAFPGLAESKLLLLGLSLFVGMLIYWSSAPSGQNLKEKVIGFFYALVNSFAIAAAALGLDTLAPS